jgi:hypothetical protein
MSVRFLKRMTPGNNPEEAVYVEISTGHDGADVLCRKAAQADRERFAAQYAEFMAPVAPPAEAPAEALAAPPPAPLEEKTEELPAPPAAPKPSLFSFKPTKKAKR